VKTIQQGKLAEDQACQYLQKQGLKLIEKNYRCRTKNDYGSALDSVDQSKIQKLISTANHYVSRHQPDRPMRFDVIGFDASLKPNWIENAFSAF